MAFTKKYASPYVARNKTIGDIDYVQNGQVVVGASASSVMITAQSDLAQLDGYTPGSIAYTAGFASMWQLDASGNWVELGGE